MHKLIFKNNFLPFICLTILHIMLITGCGENNDTTPPCPDGQYPAKDHGDCSGTGNCAEKPTACPEIWAPVCGCDGNTYGNDCEAAAAGVNVDTEGGCPVTCTSNSDTDLPEKYCKKADDDCSGTGIISDKPDACPEVWKPVCGCDGNTYGNDCEAAAAGVNVDTKGGCPVTCTSNGDISNQDQFCNKSDGDCLGTGTVTEKPDACPAVWEPVCGCDGNTYGNRCEAEAAGINVSYTGGCQP